jgi:hypothetical protein
MRLSTVRPRRRYEYRFTQRFLDGWRRSAVVHAFDLGDRTTGLAFAKAHRSKRSANLVLDLRGLGSSRGLLLAKVSPTLDVLPPICLLRPELIVSPTANPNVLGAVATTETTWFGVVELQKRSRFAATTAGRNVGAPKAVTLENTASCRACDATRLRSSRLCAASRALGFAKSFSFEIREQEIQRPLDDGSEVATRVRVAHEITTKLELFAELGARREFDAVSRLRQGF